MFGIVLIAATLLHTSHSTLVCNTDDVLCVAEPSSCTADCDYLLKYKAASSDTTHVEISGKPSAYSLTGDKFWLAYGFSATGSMTGLTIYACQLVASSYVVRKLSASGHSVSNSGSTEIGDGTIEGSYVDGVMTCTYTLSNSDLPSGDKKMAYGMGTMSAVNSMSKHTNTPDRSSGSFSLIQEYTEDEPEISCSAVSVENGIVFPAGDVGEGTTITITCNDGFESSSNDTELVCSSSGSFDGTVPTCSEIQEECEAPQEYNDCGSACTRTCSETNPACTLQCVAKCECPSSTPIWHENSCITENECPNNQTDDTLDEDAKESCNLANGCVVEPADCTDCSYRLLWTKTDTNIVIQLTGNPANYDINDATNVWIGFGFSEYGTMANSYIYLCKKIGDEYSTVKLEGYSHGIITDNMVSLDEGTVSGSYIDGILSCNYTISSTLLSQELQKMIYGMGPIGDNGIEQHYIVPQTTTEEFSMINDNVSSAINVVANFPLIVLVGLLLKLH